jgi:hypothetical protein
MLCSFSVFAFEYKKFLCSKFSSAGCWKPNTYNNPSHFLTEVFLLLTLITTYYLKLNQDLIFLCMPSLVYELEQYCSEFTCVHHPLSTNSDIN